MATTDRGYPIFSGGIAPAGPVQMQQIVEAIDADVEEVATPGAWQPVTLQNGWTAAGNNPVPRIRIDRGTVEIQGRVTGGAANTTVFMLPPGFPPLFSVAEPMVFAVDNSGASGRVTVSPAGAVAAITAPSGAGLSLNITYSR